MAKTHHIHIHMNGATDSFEEGKHPRQGGQFASSNGPGSGGNNKPSTASKFAAKHNPAAKAAAAAKAKNLGGGENEQEKLDKARQERPLL